MVTTPIVEPRKSDEPARKMAVIDSDIHNDVPSDETLYPYLPDRWRRYHEMIGLRGFYGTSYPRARRNAARYDAWPPSGLPPGSDLGFLQSQLLDTWDIEYGVLNCLRAAGRQQNLEYGAALARAHQRVAGRGVAGAGAEITGLDGGALRGRRSGRRGKSIGRANILVLCRSW